MTLHVTPIVAAFHDTRSRVFNSAVGVLGEAGWVPARRYDQDGFPADLAAHDARFYSENARSASRFAGEHGGERVKLAAGILEHLSSVAAGLNEPVLDQEEACRVALTMGVLTAMHLHLTNAPIFAEAHRALKSRKSRSESTSERNTRLADERWRDAAKEKARRMRERRPHVAATKIATAIMEDGEIQCPSHEQAVAAVRLWAKDGTIPDKVSSKK